MKSHIFLEHIGNHHYISNYVVPEVDFLINRAYSAVKEFNQTGNRSAFIKVVLVANQIKYISAQYVRWGESGGSSSVVSTMWGNRNLIGDAISYAFAPFFTELENFPLTMTHGKIHNPKDTGISQLNYTSHIDQILKSYRLASFLIYEVDRFITGSVWDNNVVVRFENKTKVDDPTFGFISFDLDKLLPQEIYKRMYACLKCFNDLIPSEVEGFELFLHFAKKKETNTIETTPLTLGFGGWTDINYAHLPKSRKLSSLLFNPNNPILLLEQEYRQYLEDRINQYKTFGQERGIFYSMERIIKNARSEMSEKIHGRTGYQIVGNPSLYKKLNNKLWFYSIPEMALLEADYLLKNMVKRN